MKTSVVIPTYNSAKMIEATLNSVFSQTAPPDEILIMDDGSTDNTVSLLRRHIPRITLFEQRNRGVATARNVLCQHAQGGLIAFLDHDDLWHPEYLATQQKMFTDHPDGAAFFTGHDNVVGLGDHNWMDRSDSPEGVEVIAALDFIQQYHRAIGKFASMSFCCVPKSALTKLGPEPFCPEVNGVDDFYLFHTLMLLGSIVFNPKCLVAYRITPGAQSASVLKSGEKIVRAMELLEPHFRKQCEPRLRKVLNAIFSSQRRQLGRMLMGVGQVDKARKQFRLSLKHSYNPISVTKSLVWLGLTSAPQRFQPKWPSQWKTFSSAAD
jgi:glycosyltransferase involved in cell wall biosynthesis